MKPRVKVLVAVWGNSYIAAFTRLALPSLLAPGNLPALADGAELTVCILTGEQDIPSIEAKPEFKALRALCPVEFVNIDDLLGSSVYGITLTLAYMRGIAAEGDSMTNVHFMFFNSDFILAEGSLRSLLAHIQAGRRVVMAPSFRAIAEDIEPVLEARVDGSRHALAVPPRELVALALRHMHATIVAKTVNQALFRSLYQNQLYWRVDKDTVLGRFYLMFMLCIRPERVVRQANTYCDYGFAPELCPSLDLAFLTDSDDFFMLETQARQHEASHIRLGNRRESDVAGYLSEWTTREHRLYAGENLVFHAADVPRDIGTFAAKAGKTVQAIEQQLPPARPHAFHPYWVGSLPLWRKEIGQHGRGANPPELEPVADIPANRTLMGRLFGLARSIARGSQDDLNIWHAGWLDQRMIERVLDHLRTDGRVLIVADELPAAANREPRIGEADQWTLRKAIDMASVPGNQEHFDDVLVFLRSQQVQSASGLRPSVLLSLIRPGGRLRVVVHDPGSEFMPAILSEPLLSMLASAFDTYRLDVNVEFTDGRLQRQFRLGVRRLGQIYMRLRWAWTPVLALGGFALLVGNVLNHTCRISRVGTGDQPDYCGTMLVTIRKA